MEWKMLYQIPLSSPNCGIKRMESRIAPTPSKIAVPLIIRLVRRTIPPICRVLTLSCISPRSLRPIFRLKIMDRKMPMLIKPRPPS